MYNHDSLKKALESDKPLLLTPKETASTGILSLYSIRKGIASGKIPFIKIGKHYRINYTKLVQMIEEGESLS